MATPQQLREDVAEVSALARADFRAFLAGIPDTEVREALLDLLPGLILSYGETAALVAAEWYDEHRQSLGVTGVFTAAVPDLRDPGVEALVRWADSEARTDLTRLSLIEGGMSRRVADGARLAVIENVKSDPRGTGFQRYSRTSPTGCGFCQALAGRGTVYRSEDTASFGAHDNCKCVAVPAFDGAPIPVRPYTPSTKNVTDADRTRTRDWLRRKGLTP